MDNLAIEILFFVVSLFGVLLTIFGVPGTFAPVFVVLLYWLTGDARFTGSLFALFLGLAVSGEVVEAVSGLYGAKKYGATKYGMLGAFIGGLFGALVGTSILPILGTVAGVFAGCFLATFSFELFFAGRTTEESARAGMGAMLGKAVAVAYKYAIGLGLLGLLAHRFWIYRG